MNLSHGRGRRVPLGVVCAIVVGLASGCGTTRLVATTNIPPPLVVKVPVTVALYVPKEFSEYVHKEKRWSTDWAMELGKAQSEGLTRLITAMFEHVVLIESINAGAQPGQDVRAILEPSVEEYAFVTPRDAGSPFYAVSVKYRMNIYSPDGKLADSWGFTGYGTSPAEGLSSVTPLTRATALAMRDAGAKLAVEFRDQAIVRGLLPEGAIPDTPVTPTPATEAAPATQTAPTAAPTVPPLEVAPATPENKDPATKDPEKKDPENKGKDEQPESKPPEPKPEDKTAVPPQVAPQPT
jgi:hypothetical protein